MKTGAIVFARMTSSRLPGKAMMDINGRSLLGRVIDRAKMIKGIDSLVIATSTDASDDVIQEFAVREQIEVYRGSLENVLLRTVSLCEYFGIQNIIRICGDRPFFDHQLVSRLLVIFKRNCYDLVTTTNPRTLPAGLTIEILAYNVLKDALANVETDFEKEHITSYLYQNISKYKVHRYKTDIFSEYIDLNLSVDTKQHLEMVSWIAKHSDRFDGSCATSQEVLALAKLWHSKEIKC